MWLFTIDGFFSVVQDDYCSEEGLMVRARWRKDLERLSDKIGRRLDIKTIDKADYRYRAKVKKNEWINYCARSASEIDYPTVKGTIAADDPGRSRAYIAVWHALLTAQENTKG
jgi:hypothetical protein